VRLQVNINALSFDLWHVNNNVDVIYTPAMREFTTVEIYDVQNDAIIIARPAR
jgi:hypothetical protein